MENGGMGDGRLIKYYGVMYRLFFFICCVGS